MSGFLPEWLALREPADHRARDRDVLAQAGWLFAGRERAAILDLGCGTGSNLRAMAHALPHEQEWRLVDHDPNLLAAARAGLAAWAESATEEAGALALKSGRKTIRVRFVEADLSAGVEPLLDPAPDLVTAAALFDLVSERWLWRFVDALATRRLPFYTALTYDGRDAFEPAHEADAEVHAAFLAHMGRDKGFGPAAGPQATEVLKNAFVGAGYRVSTGGSPWRLGPDDRRLVDELVSGIAGAVGETGKVAPERLAAWRAARADAALCVVGHTDLIAAPIPGTG